MNSCLPSADSTSGGGGGVLSVFGRFNELGGWGGGAVRLRTIDRVLALDNMPGAGRGAPCHKAAGGLVPPLAPGPGQAATVTEV